MDLHTHWTVPIALTPFDARYLNDATGAPAYPPAMRLRIVLFAYSRRIVSTRAIVLSGGSRPHFTPLTHFVSTLGDQTGPIFAAVLAVCDRRGPITGDAGYHSEANLRTLAASQEPALIADKYLLRRDVSFATQERYTTRPHPLHDKAEPARKPLAVFGPQDFQCARSAGRACVRPTCHCSDGAPRG